MNDRENRGPTQAQYEDLVKDLQPSDVIGNFKVTRYSDALSIEVCTTNLLKNFEFRYMLAGDFEDLSEAWMNWRDTPMSSSTDGFSQRMTLEQMEQCLEHRKRWGLRSVFSE